MLSKVYLFQHGVSCISHHTSFIDARVAGTAILSKIKPLSVSTTLPGHPDPESVKGRILTLEFEKCFLIGTYVVNAGQDLKTLEAKKEWNAHFTAYIRDLDRRKPVIWTGDLNVAPTEKGKSRARMLDRLSANACHASLIVFPSLFYNSFIHT